MTTHHQRALLTAIVLVTVTACSNTTQAEAPEPTPSMTAPTHTPRPQPTDADDAHPHNDHAHPENLSPETITAAAEVAAQFIDGWTTIDLAQRSRLLEPVTSGELFEMFTDPRFQPERATASGPVHLHVKGFHAVARQRLDNSTTAQVVLVIDPTAPGGWTVITIERA